MLREKFPTDGPRESTGVGSTRDTVRPVPAWICIQGSRLPLQSRLHARVTRSLYGHWSSIFENEIGSLRSPPPRCDRPIPLPGGQYRSIDLGPTTEKHEFCQGSNFFFNLLLYRQSCPVFMLTFLAQRDLYRFIAHCVRMQLSFVCPPYRY